MQEQESLIEYPCAFPIKVMGKVHPNFESTMLDVVRQYDSAYDATTLEVHPSAKGNYVAYTFTVTATSREQLDNLYRALSGHPMVAMVI